MIKRNGLILPLTGVDSLSSSSSSPSESGISGVGATAGSVILNGLLRRPPGVVGVVGDLDGDDGTVEVAEDRVESPFFDLDFPACFSSRLAFLSSSVNICENRIVDYKLVYYIIYRFLI
jgi:hypothetical protein